MAERKLGIDAYEEDDLAFIAHRDIEAFCLTTWRIAHATPVIGGGIVGGLLAAPFSQAGRSFQEKGAASSAPTKRVWEPCRGTI